MLERSILEVRARATPTTGADERTTQRDQQDAASSVSAMQRSADVCQV